MELEKPIQAIRVEYAGSDSYVLPAGTKIKFRMKLPKEGWSDFMDAEVPEDKQWNFIVSIVAHESDEV